MVAVLTTAVLLVIHRRPQARKTRGDRAAALMGTGRDLEAVSQRAAQATATRFGITAAPGIRLAGRRLGPAAGQDVDPVIPAIVGAPGAVLTTSNKRDFVDATRGVCDQLGQVWVFDLQGIWIGCKVLLHSSASDNPISF